jgi:hypothetical protein
MDEILESELKKMTKEECYMRGYADGKKDSKEQTRWIPVSEKVPEICEKDCYGNITFSKTVLATRIYGNGYVYVGNDEYTTNNGGCWLGEVPFDNPEECCKVIAWMPLPEPYKAESGDKE